MAKKKAAKTTGTNKSQAIRVQLKKTPNASVNEIADAATKQIGETVSPALVYQVKAKNGGPSKKAPARRRPLPKELRHEFLQTVTRTWI